MKKIRDWLLGWILIGAVGYGAAWALGAFDPMTAREWQTVAMSRAMNPEHAKELTPDMERLFDRAMNSDANPLSSSEEKRLWAAIWRD